METINPWYLNLPFFMGVNLLLGLLFCGGCQNKSEPLPDVEAEFALQKLTQKHDAHNAQPDKSDITPVFLLSSTPLSTPQSNVCLPQDKANSIPRNPNHNCDSLEILSEPAQGNLQTKQGQGNDSIEYESTISDSDSLSVSDDEDLDGYLDIVTVPETNNLEPTEICEKALSVHPLSFDDTDILESSDTGSDTKSVCSAIIPPDFFEELGKPNHKKPKKRFLAFNPWRRQN